MSLVPAPDCLLIAPSPVDDNETERNSRLIVVTHGANAAKVFRGVVQRIGSDVHHDIHCGDVVHYLDFYEVGELHVVPWARLVAWENDDA